MKLLIERIYTCKNYTIGKLYIDGNYFCDTLEDCDRGLTQEMSLEDIEKIKVYGKTAIPTGIYKISLSVKSPKFSNFKRYKWSKLWDGYLPRLLDVKGFSGVLIHVGNTADDLLGCIAVGQNKKKGMVLNSTATFNDLFYVFDTKSQNEEITLMIRANY